MDMKFDPLPPEGRQGRQGQAPRCARALPLVVVILIFLTWVPIPIPKLDQPIDSPFTWDEIIPSRSLEYHNCGDGFQCARLEVPMDYERTDGQGRTFALAVVRLPAKVPVTDPRYGGAVLINPGKLISMLDSDLSSSRRGAWGSGNKASL